MTHSGVHRGGSGGFAAQRGSRANKGKSPPLAVFRGTPPSACHTFPSGSCRLQASQDCWRPTVTPLETSTSQSNPRYLATCPLAMQATDFSPLHE